MGKTEKAIKQLNELKKLKKDLRLAAEGWNEDWKVLIATLLSARTRDDKTIPVANELFKKLPTIKKLSEAKISDIERIIRPVNFYKTKARNVFKCANQIVNEFGGKVPNKIEELTTLAGVGRKTANVFLAENKNGANIGVDTHVSYISQKLGWTKNNKPEKIEKDLEKLFPKNYWNKINYIVVGFGQSYRSKMEKDEILNRVRGMR